MWTHGSFFWNELMTRDVERAKAFYGATLGWTFDGMPMVAPGMPPSTYWVAKAGDKVVGGMFQMQGPEFGDVPNHWLAYIAVDDVNARVSRIQATGGVVVRAPFESDRLLGKAHSAAASVGSVSPGSPLVRSDRSPMRADLPRRARR